MNHAALLLWFLLPRAIQEGPLELVTACAVGDSMLRHKYYNEASTEYRRVLFSPYWNTVSLDTLQRSLVALIQLRLGLSLGAAGELGAASSVLLEAAGVDTSLQAIARSALAGFYSCSGEHDRSRLEIIRLIRRTEDSAARRELYRSAGWLDLQQDDVRLAAADYRAAGDESLSNALTVLADKPRRSPLTAMLLSAVVPGAGECYAGRPDRGAVSLAITGGSAAGVYLAARSDDLVSAAVVLTALFLRFYNGSRANAADLVEEYNVRRLRQSLAGLEGRWDTEPDWFEGVRRLTGPGFPEALPSPVDPAPDAVGLNRSR